MRIADTELIPGDTPRTVRMLLISPAPSTSAYLPAASGTVRSDVFAQAVAQVVTAS
jgi:hypothetical protein